MKNRKYILLISIIAMISSLSFIGCNSKNVVNKEIKEVILNKDASFRTFSGNDYKHSSRGTKLTMVNVWGTFCVECDKEFPALNELQSDYKGKDFQVIGIPLDVVDSRGNILNNKYDEAMEIINKSDINFTNIVPNKELKDSVLKDIQVVPVTFFINEDGKQIGDTYYGAKTYKEWERIIEELLK